MINLKLMKQPNDYYCGLTSLRMVLNYYGKDIREDKLIKLIGFDKKSGFDPEDLIIAPKKLGFKTEYSWNFKEKRLNELLEKKIPVIVNFHYPQFGYYDEHYGVVVGFKNCSIQFVDPIIGEIVTCNKRNFIKNAWKESNLYSNERNYRELRKREAIVIYPLK